MFSKTDPAKFVVRASGYPQNSQYPFWCADTVDDCVSKRSEFTSINDLYHFVTERMKQDQPNFRRREGGVYGHTRNPGDQLSTAFDLNEGDIPSLERMFQREHPVRSRLNRTPPFERIISKTNGRVGASEESGDMPMTMIVHDGSKKGRIVHPIVPFSHHVLDEMIAAEQAKPNPSEGKVALLRSLEETIFDDEHRWSAIAQSYMLARDTGQSMQDRKEAAVLCYYMLSHDAPLKSGSATLSRVTLEFLAQCINREPTPGEEQSTFVVPIPRQGVDLNIEALTRTWENFYAAYQKGEFFDSKARSQDVLKWQVEHLTHQR